LIQTSNRSSVPFNLPLITSRNLREAQRASILYKPWKLKHARPVLYAQKTQNSQNTALMCTHDLVKINGDRMVVASVSKIRGSCGHQAGSRLTSWYIHVRVMYLSFMYGCYPGPNHCSLILAHT